MFLWTLEAEITQNHPDVNGRTGSLLGRRSCPFPPRADSILDRQTVTWMSCQPLFSTFVLGHLRSPSCGSPEDGNCSNTHFEPHAAGLNSSKISAFMLHNREVEIIPAGNKPEFTFGRLFLWKSERKTQANTQSSQGVREKEADLMNLGLKRHVCDLTGLFLLSFGRQISFSSFNPPDSAVIGAPDDH